MSADLLPHLTPAVLARYWARIHPEPNTGCWLWAGSAAYRPGETWAVGAHLTVNYRPVLVKHIAWVLEYGPVPAGHVLRSCAAMGAVCCNPRHLATEARASGLLAVDERRDDFEERRRRQHLVVAACRGLSTEALREVSRLEASLAWLGVEASFPIRRVPEGPPAPKESRRSGRLGLALSACRGLSTDFLAELAREGGTLLGQLWLSDNPALQVSALHERLSAKGHRTS